VSKKHPTEDQKAVMLSHLRGEIEFKEAARQLGVTDIALAWMIVAYARLAVRKAAEIKNASH